MDLTIKLAPFFIEKLIFVLKILVCPIVNT
jgi:hypothetical protein